MGADAVGYEHCARSDCRPYTWKLPVFAMSVITDIGIREEENVITHEEVLEAAAAC
jgi:purine-nucleoside phosphorylase